MYTNTFAAALLAALPAVVSAGSAIVNNYCSSDVYLWSIDNQHYSPEMHTIASGGTYSEPYRSMASGGVSIKMSDSPNLYNPTTAVTQFEYTLNNEIWYDISIINGNPFQNGGLSLIPSDKACPAKHCAPGVKICTDAYNVPTDNEATAACSANADTIFNLCPDQKGSSAPAPAPAPASTAEKVTEPVAASIAPAAAAAPATTAAPAVDAEVITAVGHPDWVWTTFVTQVVTVYARDAAPVAEPTAAPVKREETSDNMHKRAAHRHHFHRHGADMN